MNYQMDYITKLKRQYIQSLIILDVTLKYSIHPRFIVISRGVVENSGSTGFIISTSNKHTTFRTLLNYLLNVSPEY
jgi:ABC-type dipeptide/oligopeptide/nickel transport system ATPase subunit